MNISLDCNYIFCSSCLWVKGAVWCFGEEIQTQNFNINNINEVIIQTSE